MFSGILHISESIRVLVLIGPSKVLATTSAKVMALVYYRETIRMAGFDGFYTYFASSGFTYGSKQANWMSLKLYARDENLIFIPSIGPGYIDTNVR